MSRSLRTVAQSAVAPLALLLLLAASGCDALTGSDPTVLTGQVVNAATNRPLPGATVQIQPAAATEQVSDSLGAYAFSIDPDSAMTVRVTAFKTGYASRTVVIAVEPGQELTVPALGLTPSDAGDGTSGPAASITLSPRSAQSLGVTGTGSTETGSLIFIALDADGRPVDAAHAVSLSVSISQGPGGGEFVSPEAPATVRTDENGEAAVTLTSGTVAGVVQVEARATVSGRTIRSQPISLVIHGGFPDQDHFSVSTALRNLPGAAQFGISNSITAIVGDRYGNPVQPGTQVYFTTTGGIIGGSAATGGNGQASVELVTANPLPPSGFATVTARTSGPDGALVQSSVDVLFSGVPQITLHTEGLELGTYTYTVSDPAGHPLAAGTSIAVTVEGTNVEARGQVAVTLLDRTSPGFGSTQFSFTIRSTGGEDPATVESIEIQVDGPNGTATGSRPGNLRTGASVRGRARA